MPENCKAVVGGVFLVALIVKIESDPACIDRDNFLLDNQAKEEIFDLQVKVCCFSARFLLPSSLCREIHLLTFSDPAKVNSCQG